MLSIRRLPVAGLSVLLLAAVVALAGSSPAQPARGPAKPPKGKIQVDGELIVRFKTSATDDQRKQAVARAGAKDAKALGRAHMRLVKAQDAARALKLLGSDPRVEYAEPNYRVYATETLPDDASFSQLWGLRNTGQAVNGSTGTPDADIDATEAWDVTTGTGGGLVAVIDTGVDFSHPDLGGSATAGSVMWTNPGENCAGCRTDGIDNDANGYVDDWRGWDFVNGDNDPFDDQGHGTHVAGTIGAVGNDGVGVTGVNWTGKIMALKFLDLAGGGTTAGAIEAIRYATAMGAPVTNNSWGGGGYSQALFDTIADADRAGSLFVAAAGNDGWDNDSDGFYPANYDLANLVSVAATDQTDTLASFSNFGARTVDVAAPGVNIYSTVPGGGYDWYDGTSMATPHVAGTAALAKAAHPAATAATLKALLTRTVDARASLTGKVVSGGRLNAGRAVGCAGTPLAWIDAPGAGFDATVGEPVEIRALAGNCGDPANVTVSASANGTDVTLTARGDGVYTGSYVPAAAGSVALTVTATAGGVADVRSVAGTAAENYRLLDAPFAWIDATAGGTRLAMTDDQAVTVTLPFTFRLYGVASTSAKISSNGYLVLGSSAATSYSNVPIPDAAQPNGLIAPYWDDLDPSMDGDVWYRTVGTAPNRKFVVAWVDVPHLGGVDGVTLEAVLEEATGDVVFQYLDVEHGVDDWNGGASATVGLEDATGVHGRQFSHNEARLTGYAGTKALRFTLAPAGDPAPPAPDTTAPVPPAGLSATPANGSIALDWADNGEADFAGYRVQLRSADGSWTTVASPTASTHTHSGLTAGVTYTYRVIAVDGSGNASTPSAEVSAAPLSRARHVPGSFAIVRGSLASGSLASLAADDGSRLSVNAARIAGNRYRTEHTASIAIPASQRTTLRRLEVRHDGHASAGTLALRVYNWRTAAWTTVDGPRSVSSDLTVSWVTTSLDYVSTGGEVRVSVLGDRSKSFQSRSDLVEVIVDY